MAPISPSFRRGLNTVQFELWHDENSAKTKYEKNNAVRLCTAWISVCDSLVHDAK